jgi:hypothetical protein
MMHAWIQKERLVEKRGIKEGRGSERESIQVIKRER